MPTSLAPCWMKSRSYFRGNTSAFYRGPLPSDLLVSFVRPVRWAGSEADSGHEVLSCLGSAAVAYLAGTRRGDEAWRWYPAQAGVVGTEVAKARGCAHMQTLMYAHS
jgi:hypothetical protein